jgi:hypothetical protein
MHAMTVPIVLGGGRVYMIKQTVYDHGDIGKTVMFDKNGLAAEFFLAREEGLSDSLREGINEGSYFDADDRTVGVLRTYHPHDKFERKEYLVPPASLALGDAIMRSAMPYAASSDGKAIARVALAKIPASRAR